MEELTGGFNAAQGRPYGSEIRLRTFAQQTRPQADSALFRVDGTAVKQDYPYPHSHSKHSPDSKI